MKKTNVYFCMVYFCFVSSLVEGAEPLHIELEKAVNAAYQHSARLQAAEHEWLAAESRAKAQYSRLGPRLSLDASYRYVSEVPTFQAAPGAPAVQFGDNKNYSYGPAVNWQIWDSGLLFNSARSFNAAARAKKEAYEAQRLRIQQAARLSYFQIQLALEQMRLIADSLQLASNQYQDISRQRKAGMLSQIDELSAHQEFLNRHREFQQSQTELAVALRELFALTGGTDAWDLTSPAGSDAVSSVEQWIGSASVIVSVESLEESKASLGPVSTYSWSENHPNIRLYRDLAEAAQRASDSVAAGHFPTIHLMAKTSRDYPNGPVLESFHQNTVAVTASLPLFEWNRVNREKKEQTELQRVNETKAEQTEIDLMRDWNMAKDRVRGLEMQQKINKTAVEESRKLADLVYDSYKSGRSTYLEVESANLRLLQSTVNSARTDVQILIQLAILDSLSPRSVE